MKDQYQQIKPQVVAVPHDGVTHHVRALTYGEFVASQKLLAEVGRDKDPAVSVLYCLCDPAGTRVFADADLPLIDALPVPLVAKLNKAAGGLMEFDPRPKASAPSTSGPTA